ncbi:C-type lectin domain family 4 member E-like [Tachysurus vachellii]|uniref:C-type lectin domain family 4 member E-like n=1 Tax=Tachysurus vachellii TaxID=175792 RepID=UPI00296B4C61|nr:C-type lectin domain family 4 member E-like [Tachysurus vachellii]
MVIITSQTEQDFLFSKKIKKHWIGLNDLKTEGQWMWVNNQPLNETGVTFWFSSPGGANEPDNWTKMDPSGENCAALGDANAMQNSLLCRTSLHHLGPPLSPRQTAVINHCVSRQ